MLDLQGSIIPSLFGIYLTLNCVEGQALLQAHCSVILSECHHHCIISLTFKCLTFSMWHPVLHTIGQFLITPYKGQVIGSACQSLSSVAVGTKEMPLWETLKPIEASESAKAMTFKMLGNIVQITHFSCNWPPIHMPKLLASCRSYSGSMPRGSQELNLLCVLIPMPVATVTGTISQHAPHPACLEQLVQYAEFSKGHTHILQTKRNLAHHNKQIWRIHSIWRDDAVLTWGLSYIVRTYSHSE